MTEPTLMSLYAAQALYERLLAAHCTESTIDVERSADELTAWLLTLTRPEPCNGELPPCGKTYGGKK